MTEQYSSNVDCINCGFSGRVVNEFGKIFKEINCPNCGTPNLQIWNKYFASTQHIRDGVVGRMIFEARDSSGRFAKVTDMTTKLKDAG